MDDSRRIVILGKTGSGKSSLVNTMLGEKKCEIGHNSKSETSECKAVTKSVHGKILTLIDTPGFIDTDRSEDDLKREIVRCIVECAPGPHAFLIVLKVERFTKHEQEVITKIKECFSEEAFKFATVVFTHGDQLEEGKTIEDFICENQNLSDLVKKCGGRCHVIDNKFWKDKPTNPEEEYRSNQFQVKKILRSVEETINNNAGGCYTNEMLQKVENKIQEEIEVIRKSSPNMSEEEIREKAKLNVFEKLLILLTGTLTGTVLGALLGVPVMVGIVVKTSIGLINKTVSAIGTLVSAGKGKSLEVIVKTVLEQGATPSTIPAAPSTIPAAPSTIPAAPSTIPAAPSTIPAAPSTISAAAKTIAWRVAVGSVAVGAVAGGVTGCLAATEAETPQEAAKKAFDAVTGGAKYILDKM